MKRYVKGSFTIEATVVIPVVLFVVGVLLYLLFYYHDKNVIFAAAHETVVYGSYLENPDEEDLKKHIEERIKGKFLLFSSTKSDITIQKEEIAMQVTAKKGMMSLEVNVAAARTYPERYIRSIQKMKK